MKAAQFARARSAYVRTMPCEGALEQPSCTGRAEGPRRTASGPRGRGAFGPPV